MGVWVGEGGRVCGWGRVSGCVGGGGCPGVWVEEGGGCVGGEGGRVCGWGRVAECVGGGGWWLGIWVAGCVGGEGDRVCGWRRVAGGGGWCVWGWGRMCGGSVGGAGLQDDLVDLLRSTLRGCKSTGLTGTGGAGLLGWVGLV